MERREAEAIYSSGPEAVVEALMRIDRELRECRAESPGDRASAPAGAPLELPGRHAAVTLIRPSGERLPAQVRARHADSLELVVMVPTVPFADNELTRTLLEYVAQDELVRMHGRLSRDDQSAPELVRMGGLRVLDVVRHDEFFRAAAARAIHLLLPGEDHEPILCETVEVGMAGCLVEGSHGLQVGDDLHFEIAIAPGEPPLRGEGRVTRLGQDGRTAIAFDHVNAIDRQRLGRFISDCRLQEGFGRG